jgi:hypothetical protein
MDDIEDIDVFSFDNFKETGAKALEVVKLLATSPGGIGLISIMVGTVLKKSRREAYRIATYEDRETITEEWKTWHANSIEAYKIYKEQVLSGGKDWLLDYDKWLVLIYTKVKSDSPYEITRNIEPKKTKIQRVRVFTDFPKNDGYDYIVDFFPLEIPGFGIKEDFGQIYMGDILIFMGLLAIGGTALSGVARGIGGVIPG